MDVAYNFTVCDYSAPCPGHFAPGNRSAVQYFSTLSHKRHDFRKKKKVIEHKMRVFFFVQSFSEDFLILRRIERDIIINIHTYLLTPWSRVLLEKITSKLCS